MSVLLPPTKCEGVPGTALVKQAESGVVFFVKLQMKYMNDEANEKLKCA